MNKQVLFTYELLRPLLLHIKLITDRNERKKMNERKNTKRNNIISNDDIKKQNKKKIKEQ